MDRGESGLAVRYAVALVDLADDQKTLDATAADLVGVRNLLDISQDLARLIRSPVISRSLQKEALLAVLERAGTGKMVRDFIAVVTVNGRAAALPAMIEAFHAELGRRRGEVHAEVRSARKLTPAQMSAVSEKLRSVFGQKVHVKNIEERSLIGGLVVQVGSRLIDASVISKLNRIEAALKAPVVGV